MLKLKSEIIDMLVFSSKSLKFLQGVNLRAFGAVCLQVDSHSPDCLAFYVAKFYIYHETHSFNVFLSSFCLTSELTQVKFGEPSSFIF